MVPARPRRTAASRDPGTGYRLGLDALHRGDSRAFEMLNTALERATAPGDVRTTALAATVLLITGQNWGYFRRFSGHIASANPVRDPTIYGS
jgi:hypothetical protein